MGKTDQRGRHVVARDLEMIGPDWLPPSCRPASAFELTPLPKLIPPRNQFTFQHPSSARFFVFGHGFRHEGLKILNALAMRWVC